jgi:acyl dehydratase
MSSKAEAGLAIFQRRVGQEEGVGEWHTVDQKQIDLFADATVDHQFIQVDAERAGEM